MTEPEVRALTSNIGAEFSNLDLRELPPRTRAQLYEALLRHRVLFFRGQGTMTLEQHEQFARVFGTPMAPPTIAVVAGSRYVLELDSRRGGRADAWHTDGAYTAQPDKVTVLRSIIVPPHCGDTLWANTVAAYASMPVPLQRLADSLWVQHSNDFDHTERPPAGDSQLAALRTRILRTEHPAVRVHPDTGERSLLLGNSMQRFVGFSRTQTGILYELLQGYITRPDNVVRWQWQPGDVAVWDNRSTQHLAINDYSDALRIMQRVSIRGDAAESIDGQTSRSLDY
ncbi:MAG TPA: TauD/TfdA family dioxygenase [Steroidobacteraceae bacterium]|jgi:taurine dioxygenase|nr:TauD/TfdA family dioxygenase [Steroidobacteraceae bacterium]